MGHLIETTAGESAQSPPASSLSGRLSLRQFASMAWSWVTVPSNGRTQPRRDSGELTTHQRAGQPKGEATTGRALGPAGESTGMAGRTQILRRFLPLLHTVGPIFLVILASAVVVAFLFVRSAEGEFSRQSAERSKVEAAHIARLFYYTVWLPVHMQVPDLPFERTVHPQIMEIFAQRSTSGLNVVKLNAWNLDEVLVWSSDPTNADRRIGAGGWYDTVVNDGTPLSELMRDQQIIDLDGQRRTLDVVRTYYPVRDAAPDASEAGEIVGVLEITQDVTAAAAEARSNTFHFAIWGSVGTGVVLFALLSLIIIKANQKSAWGLKLREQLPETPVQQAQSAKLATIGELVAGIAHELNNPLTGIWGIAQRLVQKDHGDLDPKLKRELSLIKQESERTVRIVQNLLTFARASEAEKAYTSINAAIEAALELRRYHLMVNNIELDVDLQQNLPRTMADPYKIQQVILNLIVNAEQALGELGGPGRLVVKSKEAGDSIHITVSDNGPGIAEEHLSKIFDPFFTTKGVGTGTGLGLSISYSIVREHGGTIRAERGSPEGTTFIVELPIVGSAESVEPQISNTDDQA